VAHNWGLYSFGCVDRIDVHSQLMGNLSWADNLKKLINNHSSTRVISTEAMQSIAEWRNLANDWNKPSRFRPSTHPAIKALFLPSSFFCGILLT
jgi:hypothetical protein